MQYYSKYLHVKSIFAQYSAYHWKYLMFIQYQHYIQTYLTEKSQYLANTCIALEILISNETQISQYGVY